MFLVLIETSGNQDYIFSTNKLRENIGASEATYRSCSQWVLESIHEITHLSLWDDDSDILKTNLLNSDLNTRIESDEQNLIEVIIAASGKAMVLARQLDHAKQIIMKVTLKALKEAPGLTISGAIEEFDWNTKKSLAEASCQLHRKFEVVRSLLPTPHLRSLRLPIIEDCRTSGLPTAKLELEPDQSLIPRSNTSSWKRKWSLKALDNRLPKLLANTDFRFAKSSDKILDEESDSNWLAVVHADGNGLGQIFIKFEEFLDDQCQDNRSYIQKFREFSLDLDYCTRQAFIEALKVFPPERRKPVPLVPLVLGGDDLTIVCDARYALAFTETFLTAFEEKTQESNIIRAISKKAFGIAQGQLSACAGVAIIKSHFPFSTAYQLAEELAKSAKIVKDVVKKGSRTIPCSALDFHVLYDTRSTTLEAIRNKLSFPTENTLLYNRPYIVSNIDQILQQITEEQLEIRNWLKSHHWSELKNRVRALLNEEDGHRALPNSQMHALREGLFMGRDGADGQYALIRKRYENKGITQVAAAEQSDSLFWVDAMSVPTYYVTGLLDAMDAADFWQESSTQQTKDVLEEA
jgi:hypothetical protein